MIRCIVVDCPEQYRTMSCMYLRCKVSCKNPAHKAEWEAEMQKRKEKAGE